VVTDAGHVYTKFDLFRAQAKADVIVRLLEAMKVVKKRPRHKKKPRRSQIRKK